MLEALKMAATYSPRCISAVPSAMLCVGGSAASLPPLRHAPLSRALAPLSRALAPSARLCRACPSAPASACTPRL